MFDSQVVTRLGDAVTQAAALPAALATPAQQRETVLALQQVQDTLAAVQATFLAAMADTKAYEDDGASTLTAWTRRELRLTASESAARTAAGRTVDQLDAVGASARAGRIRQAHLEKFSYGLKHLGGEVMVAEQDRLVAIAQTSDPSVLLAELRALREVVYPDSLDEAWVRGMDRRDVRLDPVPDGWHLSGFLDILTGAKFHEILTALSAPRIAPDTSTADTAAPDTTTAAERRVAGLDALLSHYLRHGMPTDKGVRPQLRVIVDHDTLAGHTTAAAARTATGSEAFIGTNGGSAASRRGDGARPLVPGRLCGFGPIGPQLLSMLACDADLLAVGVHDTDTDRHVLNVGRRHRLATPAQRTAVLTRQDDVCAVPGCTNTHLDIHHVNWWSRGGRTDLANLIGLCTRCHHLVHRQLLNITPDTTGGFTFTRATGARLDDHRRRTAHRTRRHLQHRTRTCTGQCTNRPAPTTPAPEAAPTPRPAPQPTSAPATTTATTDAPTTGPAVPARRTQRLAVTARMTQRGSPPTGAARQPRPVPHRRN